jgi:dimethylaniline monooxygenase (N-oxide forming)
MQITPNNGYAYEVISHWISSYFLRDRMNLPTPEKALLHSERMGRWLVRRYPYINVWENPSISSGIAFWK